jgi:acetyltransferase
MGQHYLDYLFSPRSIAVFGAGPAPDSVGGRVFNNLMEGGFGGTVFAIHPYPGHLASRFQLADGTNISIRPIRPEDASIEQSFVKRLSPQSKYFRFMQGLNELTQEMLIRFTQLDYHRELALIAVYEDGATETELGVARYVMNPDGKTREFALVVTDEWQGKGIEKNV